MVSYSDILDTCGEIGVELRDVDRLLLNAEAYEEFHERTEGTNLSPSNYATTRAPAVRQVDGPEMLIYVNSDGYEVEVPL